VCIHAHVNACTQGAEHVCLHQSVGLHMHAHMRTYSYTRTHSKIYTSLRKSTKKQIAYVHEYDTWNTQLQFGYCAYESRCMLVYSGPAAD
jgi:hypothetical protein